VEQSGLKAGNISGVSWLFVELNAYFASVEQELRPELRGRPVAVVPVEADTTCCIAVSYQAKSYGLQGGIGVRKAKALCPHLVLVKARPRLYIEYHERIKAAIERCVPIQQVMSCDEFACQLMGRERDPVRATEIAYAIKAEIRRVGETLRCSIGLGPNRLLAKMAGDVQKPDGLMLFEREMLPQALFGFELADIPGVGRRMEKRLRAAGITNMRELCGLRREQMHGLWGGVLGDRLWLWLRGEDFSEPAAKPVQTFSRQHILPPNCRNAERARGVAIKLLLSAARRMRQQNLWASGLFLQVGFIGREQALEAVIRFAPSQSPVTLQEHLIELWKEVPADWSPADLTVGLGELSPEPLQNLFGDLPDARERVTAAVDKLNTKYGLNSVYLGSIHDVRKEAPTRISFGAPLKPEDFDDTADED
jgi:DNA polymerase-4